METTEELEEYEDSHDITDSADISTDNELENLADSIPTQSSLITGSVQSIASAVNYDVTEISDEL